MKTDPKFYLIANATENCYYYTGNGYNDEKKELEDGSYMIPSLGAVISVEKQYYDDTDAVRVYSVLKNESDKIISAEMIGSAFITGIGRGGAKPWAKNRFIIHYTDSCWTGEAQWRYATAEQLGLYRTYNHNSQSSFRLTGKSSWSTCRHEPVVIIEDTELKKAWYAEIDCGHGWCINVGIRGYRDDIELCILTTDCFEQNDGWHKDILPGESVRTCCSFAGCVDGGFEEAVGELTKARRHITKAVFEDGLPPVCYNDYMNALWGLPTEKKTLPLIKAAAEAGCEYYVMDAGWYYVNGNDERDLGMWEVDDSKFGKNGLKGIFDNVYAHGMKPGIWFEFESVGIQADILKDHPEYILRRHGKPVGGRRVMFDFRQKGVREHIEARVKHLYDMGVRFIKNDYNANTGVGVDPDGASSVHDHAEAFYKFIDDLREKFPDLIIENCGSGAMRADMETLSHFHLQSVSDQEDYFRLPSIISGTDACIPPEMCGIWAYPYPTKIDFRDTFVPTAEFAEGFRDGKLTAYAMASGLMGLMYLSGRIECADAFNMSLIKDAIRIYRQNRKYIGRSVPVYPTGTFDIDTDGINSFGLHDAKDRVMMISVWNNSDDPGALSINLKKYTCDARIEMTHRYPETEGYDARVTDGALTVSLPAGKSATYVSLKY